MQTIKPWPMWSLIPESKEPRMRKPAFCTCKNKDADQLRGNREADQRLCFRYTDSTIHLLSKYEISSLLAIFCGCTARFVLDLGGNPEDRFSHNEAQSPSVPCHCRDIPCHCRDSAEVKTQQFENQSFDHLSLVVRKPVFRVSDQVRHKQGCTATEDG